MVCKLNIMQVIMSATLFTSIVQEVVTWRVVLFCDVTVNDTCFETDGKYMEKLMSSGAVNISVVYVSSTGNFIEDVELLSRTVTEDPLVTALMSIGNDHVSNAATCVSRVTNIPALVYSTSNHRKLIYPQSVISLHPDHAGLGSAMRTLIGIHMMNDAYVICEESRASDGFLTSFFNKPQHTLDAGHVTIMSRSISDTELRLQLLAIRDAGFRLLIVHTSPHLLHRIAHEAEILSYFEIGYAWLITELALQYGDMTSHISVTKREALPEGLLAMVGHENNKYSKMIPLWLQVTMNASISLIQESATFGLSASYLMTNLRTALVSRRDVALAFNKYILSNDALFDASGRRKLMQYRLLNFAADDRTTDATWKDIGYITDDDVDLNTVLWPGHSIFGPMGLGQEYLTIVTMQSEPFIYTRGPVASENECVADTACLKFFTTDQILMENVIDAFKNGRAIEVHNREAKLFEIHCCEGLVVDILNSMSVELKFRFLMYFKNSSDYGQLKNGTWTGMTGDVINGLADVMAGAVTLSSERIEALTFTEAFYFSSFVMIASSDDRFISLLAFLNPFCYTVWITIVASATSVALATSLFEWNSPFGLNPWGKRRKKNYTLGSALTMVYSIWFGHTVKTKSPKCWPSKWLQNCWSALAIFVLASYTANLAAFLAGSAYSDGSYRILDSQLSSKRVGVTKDSAVEDYIKTINTALHTRFRKYYVRDTSDAFAKLRTDELDLYVADSPLLEYALSKFDDNCSIKYASKHFGENAYAFGLQKGSWLKSRFDPLILSYVEMGYVEDLKWRYMGRSRQCNNKIVYSNIDDMRYGLKHTGGLFIMLLAAVGVSLCLLVTEHITYFWVTPWLRKKPGDSIWKSRNVEYFSQRLYKSINSEKIDPHVKVLLSKVKERKFNMQNRLKRQAVSVPANLTDFSYTNKPFTNMLNGLYKNLHDTHSRNLEEEIYTISDTVDDELAAINAHLNLLNKRFSILSGGTTNELAFDNPVFQADDIDNDAEDRLSVVVENNDVMQRTENVIVHQSNQTKVNNDRSIVENSDQSSTIHTRECGVKRGKRYETWPSPQTKRKRSLKKNQTNGIVSFSTADRDRLVTNPNAVIVNNIGKSSNECRKCSSASLDSLSKIRENKHCQRVRFNMKDNRMKYSLRQHAMASVDPNPSAQMDACAVEALSKEDLLVLWKRSEIELQTKLNQIVHQNNHLRQIVNRAEEVVRRNSESSYGITASDSPHSLIPTIMSTKL